jgi:hypothetical protein
VEAVRRQQLGHARCSFSRKPGRHPRRTLARVALRVSIGSRRKSVPFSSSRSKAYKKAYKNTWRPARLQRSRSNTANPFSSQATASPSIRQERTLSRFIGFADERIVR